VSPARLSKKIPSFFDNLAGDTHLVFLYRTEKQERERRQNAQKKERRRKAQEEKERDEAKKKLKKTPRKKLKKKTKGRPEAGGAGEVNQREHDCAA
jgi:hypothetical protein